MGAAKLLPPLSSPGTIGVRQKILHKSFMVLGDKMVLPRAPLCTQRIAAALLRRFVLAQRWLKAEAELGCSRDAPSMPQAPPGTS